MDQNFLARIQEAAKLVRAGKTSSATTLIQSNLLRRGNLGFGTAADEAEQPQRSDKLGSDKRPLPLDGDILLMPASAGQQQHAASSGRPKSTSTAPFPKPRRPLGKVIDLLKGMRLPTRDASLLRQGDAQIPEPVPDGAAFLSFPFACEAGSRNYKLYMPSCSDRAPRPLVIMLHGCTQDPDDFAAGTGMNRLAEEFNFLVAYPEQSSAFNQMKCWNWFNPGDQIRDHGEPAVIAGIAKAIMAEQDVDPARVFVVGMSAGGAMAAVLGAAYPDVFTGIGVHSGLPYRAASDVPSAFAAMRNHAARDILIKKRSSSPRLHDSALRAIVFHGDADATVHPDNGGRLFTDACESRKVDINAFDGVASGGRRYSVRKAVAHDGEVVAEHWLIRGGGHAWSGGRAAGSYTDPQGPNASREMLRFFFNDREGLLSSGPT